MSTRSRIGYVLPSGKVKHVFCHWDGYPSWNGRILMENYNSPKKARNLVGLGSICFLDKEIAQDPDGGVHDLDKHQENVTVVYHRDGGCAWKDSRPVIDTLEAFLHPNWNIEFLYLFKDGEWFVCDTCDPNRRLFPMTKEIADSNEWENHKGFLKSA